MTKLDPLILYTLALDAYTKGIRRHPIGEPVKSEIRASNKPNRMLGITSTYSSRFLSIKLVNLTPRVEKEKYKKPSRVGFIIYIRIALYLLGHTREQSLSTSNIQIEILQIILASISFLGLEIE
ncbi:hypothetical protein PCH_Pc16g07280 [Penicillium rubens Wisconsin 54-1255]|uniref:Uncharacterized protein n=1 Tax=Penicillium rubens (strain ATCC 28089 / DSM 1075 / NRRL 1951 / Wisconsin 54-1255) TaxID=500485 RepID=B6H7H0_PENRW|nr:hypothetical protein PCH_Pc16g07280 [Penicillium rubens Wisconsin 54-1255]